MKLTEFWREPKVLVCVYAGTVVFSILNAVAGFSDGRKGTAVFWMVSGILFALSGFGIYYWNIGRGAKKIEEAERQRRKERDDFYKLPERGDSQG